MREAEVVIVGGGIGGTVLALALARGGRSSVILEKAAAPSRTVRPEILWPATAETLTRLGASAALGPDAAMRLTAVDVQLVRADGRIERLVRLGADLPAAATFRRWSTDPVRTREILLETALATGRVELRRGVEAKEFLRDARGVTVRGEGIEVRAAFLVGDDGGNSRVRASLGIEMKTKMFPAEFICGVARGAAVPADEGVAWLNPSGLADGPVGAFLVPLPGGRVAIVLPSAFGAFERMSAEGHDAFRTLLARIAPPAAHLADGARFPQDFACFRRPVGNAPTYVADRAAILGDAAHPVSPAGGQGANMAVADAAALSEVLLARLASGDLSAAALAPFDRARRAANDRSVAFSRRASRIIVAARRFPVLLPLLGVVTRGLERSTRTKDRVLRALATSFVGEPVELDRN